MHATQLENFYRLMFSLEMVHGVLMWGFWDQVYLSLPGFLPLKLLKIVVILVPLETECCYCKWSEFGPECCW